MCPGRAPRGARGVQAYDARRRWRPCLSLNSGVSDSAARGDTGRVKERSTAGEEVRRACRAALDPIALYQATVPVLAPVLRFDRWCGLLLDPATLMNTGGHHDEGLPPEVLPRLLQIEVEEGDANAIPTLNRSRTGVSTLDRATCGRPTQSRRFQEILAPVGLGHEMRALLRDRNSVWGALVLFRSSTEPDFSDEDLALVAQIGADLARAVRRCLLHSEHTHRDDPDGPGVVMLTVDGMDVSIDLASRAACRWLDDIPDGRLQPSGTPLAVVTLVQRALRSRNGAADTRLRGRSGQWLTLFAETVEATQPQMRATSGRLSLVIEPTRPHELAEVIADAYALTTREREVARLVVAGLSNREIAAALWLSVYTVQDHLKAVYSKLDVRSRAQLTSRLFFDHYLPRQVNRTPLGADGWYVT